MRFRRRAALLALALLCAPLASCQEPSRGLAVERYDVAIRILADTSLEVHETITLRASAPGARFVRDIPVDRIDAVSGLAASLNGAPFGGSIGQLQIDQSASRVVYAIAESGRAETLEIRYQLSGALAAQGPRGLLRWPVLPLDRSFPVDVVRITVRAPDSAVFTEGPSINDGQTPAARDAHGLSAELSFVQPGQPVIVRGEIDFGNRPVMEPEWQLNLVRIVRLTPAFLAGGACIIVIAIGTIVMLRLHVKTSGLAETDQRSIGKGLRQTGWVAIVLAFAVAAAIRQWLSYLGIWPMAIPVGLAVMGVLFIWWAGRLPRQYTSRL